MRKKLISMLTVITCFVALFTGCGNKSEDMSNEILQLQNQIDDLNHQKDKLETEVVDKKIENGTAVYVVTINVAQSHPFWDIGSNIKDDMNDVDIDIPVSKEFYDSVNVGTVLDDSFRMGSFIMSGSYGSWDITVSDKKVE